MLVGLRLVVMPCLSMASLVVTQRTGTGGSCCRLIGQITSSFVHVYTLCSPCQLRQLQSTSAEKIYQFYGTLSG